MLLIDTGLKAIGWWERLWLLWLDLQNKSSLCMDLW